MKRHGGSRSGGSRTVIPTVLSEGRARVDKRDSAVGSTTHGFNIALLTHFGRGPDFSSGSCPPHETLRNAELLSQVDEHEDLV